MQTISTIASTKFLVILLHISEDRLVVVVVTHGVTGTRTLDIGSCESHLSHVSFVSLQADSQTHGTRTRVHEVQCDVLSVDAGVLLMF